jgi:hypothetical protein
LAAFFAGRLVSYTLYVTAASAAKDSLGDVLGDAVGSPLGIALLRTDWAKLLARTCPDGVRGPCAPRRLRTLTRADGFFFKVGLRVEEHPEAAPLRHSDGSGRRRARLRAVWSVRTVGVRISLGA